MHSYLGPVCGEGKREGEATGEGWECRAKTGIHGANTIPSGANSVVFLANCGEGKRGGRLLGRAGNEGQK